MDRFDGGMVKLGRATDAPQAAKTSLFPARTSSDALDSVYVLASLSPHELFHISSKLNRCIDAFYVCSQLIYLAINDASPVNILVDK